MLAKNRSLPPFLAGQVDPPVYERWLNHKARAHAKRDQKRWKDRGLRAEYRELIHAAVLASQGKDQYTGEQLDWSLLSKYNNEESKAGGHGYKAKFALLPTVDHVQADDPNTDFCICAWRTNDSKHDLSRQDFLELCRRVLQHHGFAVSRDQ